MVEKERELTLRNQSRGNEKENGTKDRQTRRRRRRRNSVAIKMNVEIASIHKPSATVLDST